MRCKTFAFVGVILLGGPSFAEQLTPKQAMQFMSGRKWSYTCPLGTTGSGHFNLDGSADARFQAVGFDPEEKKFPAGAIHPYGDSLCMPAMFGHDVCFIVDKTDKYHFVGRSSFLSFFACNFVADK